MSCETKVPITLHFSHKTYEDLWDVKEDQEDLAKMIKSCENQLLILAAGSPKDLLNCKDIDGYPMDPMEILDMRVSKILEELKDYIIEQYKLDLLEANFDQRSGTYIGLTAKDLQNNV